MVTKPADVGVASHTRSTADRVDSHYIYRRFCIVIFSVGYVYMKSVKCIVFHKTMYFKSLSERVTETDE